MERQQEKQQSDAMIAAIERVLKIERDGVEQLQLSQERARQLLSQARDQAIAIERRTDARISKLHNSYLQKVQREIERLAQSSLRSGGLGGSGHDQLTLTQAVRRVAAKLTGAT